MKKLVIIMKKNKKLSAGLFILLIIGGTVMFSCSATLSDLAKQRKVRMEKSPHWEDGQFNNSLKREDGSMLKIMGKMFEGREDKAPEKPVPVVKLTKEDFAIDPESGLRMTWMGHSSVLIEIEDKKFLTDPVWSERCSPVSFAGPKRFFPPPIELSDLPEIDAVIISHNHFDHLDKETIIALKDVTPKFIIPLGVGNHFEEWGVDPTKIKEFDWWESTKVGDIELTATPARHFSGRTVTSMFGNETLWSGWAVKGSKHSVYYSGDTAMFPGFKEIGERLGPFDITMFEVGAYNKLWSDVHVGPEQAVEAHKMVKGKTMLPVHWGTFDLAMHSWTEPAERVMAAAEKESINVVIPKPGQSFELTNLPKLEQWWPETSWQNAEEAPIISTGL